MDVAWTAAFHPSKSHLSLLLSAQEGFPNHESVSHHPRSKEEELAGQRVPLNWRIHENVKFLKLN